MSPKPKAKASTQKKYLKPKPGLEFCELFEYFEIFGS